MKKNKEKITFLVLILVFLGMNLLNARINCSSGEGGGCRGCWCEGNIGEGVIEGEDCCVACLSEFWYGEHWSFCCLDSGCYMEN